MKPESGAYLRKARTFLDKAVGMRERWPDEAGRAVYVAGFHAAQAWIFEHGDRVPKTHSGVQAQFARLVRDDSRFDAELRSFLGRAYNLKSVADYHTSPIAEGTGAEADEALRMAGRLVGHVENLWMPIRT